MQDELEETCFISKREAGIRYGAGMETGMDAVAGLLETERTFIHRFCCYRHLPVLIASLILLTTSEDYRILGLA